MVKNLRKSELETDYIQINLKISIDDLVGDLTM